MKSESLAEATKSDLEQRHRYERDGLIRGRIKAVLLKNEGWTDQQTAQALPINEETVRRHLKDWLYKEKLKSENGGSMQKPTDVESNKDNRVSFVSTVYMDVKSICAWVLDTFGMSYGISGMTKWLHAHTIPTSNLGVNILSPCPRNIFSRITLSAKISKKMIT